jgi:hypothetical protein
MCGGFLFSVSIKYKLLPLYVPRYVPCNSTDQGSERYVPKGARDSFMLSMVAESICWLLGLLICPSLFQTRPTCGIGWLLRPPNAFRLYIYFQILCYNYFICSCQSGTLCFKLHLHSSHPLVTVSFVRNLLKLPLGRIIMGVFSRF